MYSPTHTILPHATLHTRIHAAAHRTPKIGCEFRRIPQRSQNAEHVRRVKVCRYRPASRFRFHNRAPILCGRYPEQLLLAVRQRRQKTLSDVGRRRPVLISIVGDFHAAAVGDVLALRAEAIQLFSLSRTKGVIVVSQNAIRIDVKVTNLPSGSSTVPYNCRTGEQCIRHATETGHASPVATIRERCRAH